MAEPFARRADDGMHGPIGAKTPLWTLDPERDGMPDRGTDLGADLYHLWLAGRDDLPAVAGAYGRTAGDLSNTDVDVYVAMWRPARFGGDNYGPVLHSWTALRDELQSMLSETAQNLALTGEALCLAAHEYAKTDSGAAAEMKRLIEVDGVTT